MSRRRRKGSPLLDFVVALTSSQVARNSLLLALVEFQNAGELEMNIEQDQTNGQSRKHPGDETEPGSRQSADGICPKCGGSGRLNGQPCSDCRGDGIVTVIVGDA
jgi:hypothetical protein